MPTNDTKTSATPGYQPMGSQPPSQATGVGSSQTSSSDRSRQASSDRDHDMSNKKLDQTHLLQKLHHVNQEEIKAGQLAQQKASSSDVKSYGAMLVIGFLLAAQVAKYLARRCGLDGETFVNAGLLALMADDACDLRGVARTTTRRRVRRRARRSVACRAARARR